MRAFCLSLILTVSLITAPRQQPPSELSPLGANAPLAREIAGGQTHAYRLALAAGQYAEVRLTESRIDLALTLSAPRGEQIMEADGAQATERVSLVADAAGDYRVEVRALDPAEVKGSYQIQLVELRPATERDQDRVAAARLFAAGEHLRKQGTKQSLAAARDQHTAALPLWRAAADRRGEAETLGCLAEIYYATDDMPRALAALTEALPASRAAGDRRLEAGTLSNLGTIYDTLNDQAQASACFRQALALQRELGDRRGEMVTLNNLGALHGAAGESRRALDYLLQALPLAREFGDRQSEATALSNIGLMYDRLNEKQQALDHYEQSLALCRELRNQRDEAGALNLMASLYQSLDELPRARELLERALELRRATGDRGGEARTLSNLGVVYDQLGDLPRAAATYERALELRRAAGDRRGLAVTLDNLAMIYAQTGEPAKALALLRESLELRRALGDREGQAAALHNLAWVSGGMGDKQAALAHLEQALALLAEIEARRGTAPKLSLLARTQDALGRPDQAQASIERALALVEETRARLNRQELRTTYLTARQSDYEYYIDLLMRRDRREPGRGFAAAALQASERARARSLLELLAEARAEIREGVDPALIEREAALQRELGRREQARSQLLNGRHTAEQAESARREVEVLLAQIAETRAQIRARSPRYAALTQPVPLSLAEIQAQVLDRETLLLAYALGTERSYLWAVTPTGLASFELAPRAEIEAAARSFSERLTESHRPGRRVATEMAAERLSRLLLAPVAAQLGRQRLLIVGDGILQTVPFAALPAPAAGDRGRARPLIADHEIVSLPSASVLGAARQELAGRAPAERLIAVLSDPVFEPEDPRVTGGRRPAEVRERPAEPLTRSAREVGLTRFMRLPYARQEATSILALARPEARLAALDFAASRATAESPELSRYRIVHFATHGLLNTEHPDLSGIVLSLVDESGKPQNGFVRLADLYNLKLKADLVVLSACRTALGKEVRGEGVVGLTRGFMYAGAARVVASLWDVQDEATAELMKRFYQGMLARGLSPAAALRAAQLSFLREPLRSAPYYWAGFVLQGEWR